MRFSRLPQLSPLARSATLALSAALSAAACAEERPEETYSGKKKIAYAPYQRASVFHIAPAMAATAAPAAAQGAVSAQLGDAPAPAAPAAPAPAPAAPAPAPEDGAGMIAAGWPGAGGQQPAPNGQTPAPHGQAPAPHGQAPAPHGQPALPAGHPAAGGQAPAPHGQPGDNPHGQTLPGAPVVSGHISGEITIKPELLGTLKAGSVMFVIVRRYDPNGGQGMLLASTKIGDVSAATFPKPFVVQQKDSMMGAPLAGQVVVSARVDQDGDAISKQPGDIVGNAGAVMVGTNPVNFELNGTL
ncbi:MAG: hypothetical protein FJ138_14095 [Deltaproteobacteria bacterium]|nr:hypothetical protein [Deltaproteobacteria bacterium]